MTLLVNNAGMSLNGDTLDNSADEIETIIALNVTAAARLAVAAGKAFGARGKGGIVNIASILGVAHEIYEGVYAGSKGFVINLSRNLSAKLRDKGVTVQAVLPGATRTEIWERSGKDIDAFPAEMVMGVDDLVDAALVGFDRGEEVTIPPLADEGLWTSYETARVAMLGELSKRDPAPRYREAVLPDLADAPLTLLGSAARVSGAGCRIWTRDLRFTKRPGNPSFCRYSAVFGRFRVI